MGRPETRLELVADAAARGERLDRWLTRAIPGLSRSRIQALIAAGAIRVDGESRPARARLRGGERVLVDVPAPVPVDLEPDPDVPFDLVHEDEDLAVIHKPVGVVVHPAPGHRRGTLVHGLLARLSELSDVGGRARPGIVHRLDRDTSGLLVVAKNDHAHRALQAQLEDRSLGRIYDAICWGAPRPDRDRIDLPLARDPRDRLRRAVVESGKRAITDYRLVESLAGASHLRLRLHTGRTHQIRVHLACRGHPVLADALYGGGEGRLAGAHPPQRAALAAALGALEGQALHASRLRFDHPRTGRRMRFEAPLPAGFERALGILRVPGAP